MIYLKNLILSICVLSFLSSHLLAQQGNTPYSPNLLLELLRTQEFDWIQEFCEGLALASKDGKMMIINSEGEKQFDFPYDYSKVMFDEGFCVVTKDNLYGIINNKGEVIAAPIFEAIRSSSPSMIVGRQNQMDGFYDIKTKKFNPICESRISTRDHIHFIYANESKSGVINSIGDTILPFEYQDITTKKGEFFVVKKENLFGVVNKKNEVLIPIKHEFLYMISIGDKPYFIMKAGNRYGLLDEFNKTKIKPENLVIEYDRAGYLFVKKENKYIIFDKEIKRLFEEEYESVRPLGYGKYIVKSKNEVGVFDSKNGDITGLEYTTQGKFSNQCIIFKENGLYGLLDTNLVVLIKPSYNEIKHLNMNLLRVKNEDGVNLLTTNNELILNDQYEDLGRWIYDGILTAKKNGKWGLINIKGDSLTVFKYDKIIKLRNSKYFQVEIDKAFGIIDIEGGVLKECTLEKIKDNGQHLILKENSKYGLIGKNGKSIAPIQYDNIRSLGLQYGRSYPNLFRVKKDNKIGILNTHSNKSIDFKYDKLEELRIKSIVATVDSKFGLIDPYENEITPFKYSYLEDNGNSSFVYASSPDNKVGLLNRKGEVVVPLEYQTVKNYDNKLIAVKKDDLWGFVDHTGQLVIQNKFKSVASFRDNFCVIKNERLQGLIDRKGEIIIPPVHQNIYRLSDDCYGFTLDGKQGMYDTTGVNLLLPIYDKITSFSHGRTVVKKDEKYGIFDNRGQEVLPITLDKIKRKTKSKTVKRFSSVSRTSSPSKLFDVTFEEYKFTIDNDGNCLENCPPENILKKILQK